MSHCLLSCRTAYSAAVRVNVVSFSTAVSTTLCWLLLIVAHWLLLLLFAVTHWLLLLLQELEKAKYDEIEALNEQITRERESHRVAMDSAERETASLQRQLEYSQQDAIIEQVGACY